MAKTKKSGTTAKKPAAKASKVAAANKVTAKAAAKPKPAATAKPKIAATAKPKIAATAKPKIAATAKPKTAATAKPKAAAKATAKPKAAAPATGLGKSIAAKPIAGLPITGKPITAKPIAAKPIAAKPIAAKPIAAKPIAAKPIAAEPIAAEPIAAKPIAAKAAKKPAIRRVTKESETVVRATAVVAPTAAQRDAEAFWSEAPPRAVEPPPEPRVDSDPPPGPRASASPEPEPEAHTFIGAPLLPRDRAAGPALRRPSKVGEESEPRPPAPGIQKARATTGEFADFWSQPDANVNANVNVNVNANVNVNSNRASAGQPGQQLPSSEGRRRRRRRRRRGGIMRGPDGQAILGPDGQPIRRSAPPEGQAPPQGQPGQHHRPARHPHPQGPVDPIHRRLRRQFNLRDFRPGQEQVIRALLKGRDVLAIMPTGAGKSLTYQLTAFELPGVTIVVSPLLALMSDQLIKMRRTGAVAARLDSTETRAAKRATLERIEQGQHKVIYVTPERAASGALLTELGGQQVSLFVVDEAHCVSEWGHDFRPAYLSLKQCIDSLAQKQAKRPPVLALTATATPQVADDILHQLNLKEADRVHTGFNRPSLAFDVRPVVDLKQQVRRLLRLMRRIRGPGIVYCSTVRDVEALHGALPRLGLKVGMYHGKMNSKERDESQRSFMRNNPRIMIATNAFGLGVDKPDIRFVIHYNVPGSIEAYYQEAGRAGRDGKPSRCILLYNPNDEEVQEFFVGGKYPNKSEFTRVAYALSTGEGNLRDMALRAETSQAKARVVLGVLKEHGFAEEHPGVLFTMLGEPDELTLGRAAEEYRKRREADRGKLEAMIRYARSTRCRVKILLEYFGETEVPLCQRCDNCVKFAADADKERTVDLMSPLEVEEMEEDREPLPELPQAPPPPRKDPTRMF